MTALQRRHGTRRGKPDTGLQGKGSSHGADLETRIPPPVLWSARIHSRFPNPYPTCPLSAVIRRPAAHAGSAATGASRIRVSKAVMNDRTPKAPLHEEGETGDGLARKGAAMDQIWNPVSRRRCFGVREFILAFQTRIRLAPPFLVSCLPYSFFACHPPA